MSNIQYKPTIVEGTVDRISTGQDRDIHLVMLVGDKTIYSSRKGEPLDVEDVVVFRMTRPGDSVELKILPGEAPRFFEFANKTIDPAG
jgi:hypothetical protein